MLYLTVPNLLYNDFDPQHFCRVFGDHACRPRRDLGQGRTGAPPTAPRAAAPRRLPCGSALPQARPRKGALGEARDRTVHTGGPDRHVGLPA